MLELLVQKKLSLIGVEIGSSVVRVLELSRQGNKYQVEAYSKVLLPEKAVQGKAFKDNDAIVGSLKEAIYSSGTKAKHAVVCVSDSSIISKVIQLEDGVSEAEEEELVVLEADKYIPFAIEDVSIDFQVLGPAEKRPGFNDVFVVASRAENVNTLVDLLYQSGLETKIVDVESFAIQRSCEQFREKLLNQGDGKLIAVLNIGEHRTQLTVLDDMQVVFTQEEEFGGRQLTEEIARFYGLSLEESIEAKMKNTLPEDYKNSVLSPYLEMIILQIKRVLQYFYSTTSYSVVDMLVLAGGSSQVEGLVELVESDLELPALAANPIVNMSFAKQVNSIELMQDAPSLMTVCGLALRKFQDN